MEFSDYLFEIPDTLHMCPGCTNLASVNMFCDSCASLGVPAALARLDEMDAERHARLLVEDGELASPAARAAAIWSLLIGGGFAWRLIFHGMLRLVAAVQL